MALQADQVLDLIATTQNELGEDKWVDLAQDLQEYTALPMLMKKSRVNFRAGPLINFNVQVEYSGQAEMHGLFSTVQINTNDVMIKGEIPWRHARTKGAIEEIEIDMNRQPRRIVELLKVTDHTMDMDLANLCETQWWTGATGPSTDDIWGVPNWIVKAASATEGFNGGNPSGFTSGVANINSTTYPAWANYNGQYVSVSKADLIRKWRKASVFTNFKPPIKHPDYNTGNNYGYYTNYDVVGALEEALEAQNDNLGNDVASKDGKTLFRGTPVQWVPFLEADTQDPVYGINWGVFHPVFLEGRYMKRLPPMRAPHQPTVIWMLKFLTMNLYCTDRRRLFVLNKA